MTHYDPFLLSLVLPKYRPLEQGAQPAEADFAPFNLAYLDGLVRTDRSEVAHEVEIRQPKHVEAFA